MNLHQVQPETCMLSRGTIQGVQRLLCWTTPVWLHFASASGPLQRSTAVPPTLEDTRPTGTFPSRLW